MSVPARPRAPRKPAAKAPTLAVATPGAPSVDRTFDSHAAPSLCAVVPGAVERVRTTITGTGGTVVAVVDHASTAGMRIPRGTSVPRRVAGRPR